MENPIKDSNFPIPPAAKRRNFDEWVLIFYGCIRSLSCHGDGIQNEEFFIIIAPKTSSPVRTSHLQSRNNHTEAIYHQTRHKHETARTKSIIGKMGKRSTSERIARTTKNRNRRRQESAKSHGQREQGEKREAGPVKSAARCDCDEGRARMRRG